MDYLIGTPFMYVENDRNILNLIEEQIETIAKDVDVDRVIKLSTLGYNFIMLDLDTNHYYRVVGYVHFDLTIDGVGFDASHVYTLDDTVREKIFKRIERYAKAIGKKYLRVTVWFRNDSFICYRKMDYNTSYFHDSDDIHVAVALTKQL